MDIRRTVFLLILFLTCIVSSKGQTPEKLAALSLKQANEMAGKHIVWNVKVSTFFDADQLNAHIDKLSNDIAHLDKHDPSYATNKSVLDGMMNAVQRAKNNTPEEVQITADIVSLTKWRVTWWPKSIPQDLATVYVADGTRNAFQIEAGNRIVEWKDALAALANAIPGVPVLVAQSGFPTNKSASAVSSSENNLVLSYRNTSTSIATNVLFDKATLRCTGIEEVDDLGRVLTRIASNSNQGSTRESYSFSGANGRMAQKQEWPQGAEEHLSSTPRSQSPDWERKWGRIS